MIKRSVIAFAAGFVATLVFHQAVLALLHTFGFAPRAAWPMQGVPPFGIPSVISLAFWGVIFGLAGGWIDIGDVPLMQLVESIEHHVLTEHVALAKRARDELRRERRQRRNGDRGVAQMPRFGLDAAAFSYRPCDLNLRIASLSKSCAFSCAPETFLVPPSKPVSVPH